MNLKKILGWVTYIFVFSVLPSLLIYFGKHKNALDELQKKGILGTGIDIGILQEQLFIIGIIISAFIVPIIFKFKEEYRLHDQEKLIDTIRFTKILFIEALKKELKCQNATLKVRVFMPDKGTYSVKNLFGSDKYFKLTNLKGISDIDGVQPIKFRVEPSTKLEGIVGIVYHNKNVYYDNDVQNNSLKYNLTDYQKSKTVDTEFIIAAPIFDNKSKVIAIFAIDSMDKIDIPPNSYRWQNILNKYIKFIHHQIPVLHKLD